MIGQIILFSIPAIALALLIRGIYETFRLDVSFSVLGKGGRTLRVLLFSDLHARFFNISKRRLRKAALSSPVDAFLFAGDMTCGASDRKKAETCLSFFSSLAKESGVPFYAVLGNHDRFGLEDKLSGLGIVLLRNQSVPIDAADGSVWLLVGLDDPKTGMPSYETALKSQIKGVKELRMSGASESTVVAETSEPFEISEIPEASKPSQACPRVVLAHNPDAIFLLPGVARPKPEEIQHPFASSKPESDGRTPESLSSGVISTRSHSRPVPPVFLLSGHFHGGQIWMPFHFEYRVLRKEIMPKIGLRKGAYTKDGIIGYITRGLGCVIVPLRFLSYPELAFLELRTGSDNRS